MHFYRKCPFCCTWYQVLLVPAGTVAAQSSTIGRGRATCQSLMLQSSVSQAVGVPVSVTLLYLVLEYRTSMAGRRVGAGWSANRRVT